MATKTIEVVYSTKGMKALIDSTKKIARAFDMMNASASGNAVNSFAVSMARGASYLEMASRNIRKAADDLKIAAQAFVRAKGKGSGPKGQQYDFWKNFRQMILSSRFSLGGGGFQLMPLIGRFLKILPPQLQAIGALGMTAVGAGFALKAFADRVAEVTESFVRLKLGLGSSNQTTAGLMNLGASIGLNADSIAGIAKGFQDAITNDPVARAFASRMGIFNIGSPWGNPDYGTQLLRAIEELRKISDPIERIVMARTTGLESVLPMTKISDNQWSKIKADFSVTEQIFNDSMQSKIADFLSSTGRFGQSIQNLLVSLGGPIIDDLTKLFNFLADTINSVASFAARNQNAVRVIYETMKAILSPFAYAAGKSADAVSGMNKELETALNKNTEALEKNTKVLGLIPGTFGRGMRNGAIPEGVGGEYLRRGLEAGGFRFSAF
jgi:hypothetical protein